MSYQYEFMKKGAEEVLVSSSACNRRGLKNSFFEKLIPSLTSINLTKLSADTISYYSRKRCF
ncbi:hypothetical protein MUP77_20255 [Candidatus Bathyarchaeota archaeon]|nr:hypothetical protein [Candidatus Bathyarchaeota archaeon]